LPSLTTRELKALRKMKEEIKAHHFQQQKHLSFKRNERGKKRGWGIAIVNKKVQSFEL